jgi:N-acetylmuramoyl-L-alanine amidase
VRFGRESRGRRPFAVAAMALAVAAATAVLAHPASLAAQAAGERTTVRVEGREHAVAVARHRGYPAFAWTDVPGDLVRGAAFAEGRGTGTTVAGVPLELRSGSPFARVGPVVVPLANEPYVEGGALWVPTSLLASASFSAAFAEPDSGPPSSSSPDASAPGAARASSPASGRTVRRVMIDPGHGGHDPGTVNRRTGSREKDIVLAVSRYLREELERRSGIEPVLTRSDDRFIPLKQRPKMARQAKADLFISIHVNAEPKGSSARGFETYYLAPARNEESSRVARLENSVLELEGDEAYGAGDGGIDKILAMLTRDDNRDVSGRFGGYVQNAFRGSMDGPDRGVKPGPFWVLVGATGHMPAVLVELGFITNAQDEKRLTSVKEQKRIAGAIADAIEQYFDYYEGARARLNGAG